MRKEILLYMYLQYSFVTVCFYACFGKLQSIGFEVGFV